MDTSFLPTPVTSGLPGRSMLSRHTAPSDGRLNFPNPARFSAQTRNWYARFSVNPVTYERKKYKLTPNVQNIFISHFKTILPSRSCLSQVFSLLVTTWWRSGPSFQRGTQISRFLKTKETFNEYPLQSIIQSTHQAQTPVTCWWTPSQRYTVSCRLSHFRLGGGTRSVEGVSHEDWVRFERSRLPEAIFSKDTENILFLTCQPLHLCRVVNSYAIIHVCMLCSLMHCTHLERCPGNATGDFCPWIVLFFPFHHQVAVYLRAAILFWCKPRHC